MSVERRSIRETKIEGGSSHKKFEVKMATADDVDKTTVELSKPNKRGARLVVELTWMELDDLADMVESHKEQLYRNSSNDIGVNVTTVVEEEEGVKEEVGAWSLTANEEAREADEADQTTPGENVAIGKEDNRCPTCGSKDVHWDGLDQAYRCNGCGTFNIENGDLIGDDDTPRWEEGEEVERHDDS